MNGITKLSDLSASVRESVEKAYIKSGFFMLPNPYFDKNGLRYPPEHLRKIKGKIILFPIEFMACYVDVVTKVTIDDNKQFEFSVANSKCFPEYNATSIGNVAYIALYCFDEKIKERAMDFLEKYYIWYKNKL